jgi:hypothetical protein
VDGELILNSSGDVNSSEKRLENLFISYASFGNHPEYSTKGDIAMSLIPNDFVFN